MAIIIMGFDLAMEGKPENKNDCKSMIDFSKIKQLVIDTISNLEENDFSIKLLRFVITLLSDDEDLTDVATYYSQMIKTTIKRSFTKRGYWLRLLGTVLISCLTYVLGLLI